MTIVLPTSADITSENGWSKEQKIAFFESAISSTNRPGADKVLAFVQKTDFYNAPSSMNHHSNYMGGLLDHSLLTYSCAVNLKKAITAVNPELDSKLKDESIVVSALLHDLCKTNFYTNKQKWYKDANDQWQSYIGFEIQDNFPIGHGEKSVIILQSIGFQLEVEEMLAIRWHMGAWDGIPQQLDQRYAYMRAMEICPLCTLIQMADNMSSLYTEKEIVHK